jgi:hypothetical protein
MSGITSWQNRKFVVKSKHSRTEDQSRKGSYQTQITGELQVDLLKKLDAIQKFDQETTYMMLREFAYGERSEFEVIRTTPGLKMTREMFVDMIGKQEKLKKGVKMRNQHGIVAMKCSGSPRDGIGGMTVIGKTSGVDQVEGGGEL